MVSEGELTTALKAGFPPEKIFLHGNNKSHAELELAVANKGTRVVVDSLTELEDLIALAGKAKVRVPIMMRIIPAIELATHSHNRTGHSKSKFGIALDQLGELISLALKNKEQIELLGLSIGPPI